MVVGVLEVELLIPGSNSLKDKRQVIRSLLDGIRNKHHVSAAELDELDSWRHSIVGFACISNDQKVANSILNRVLAGIESDPRVSVSEVRLEFM